MVGLALRLRYLYTTNWTDSASAKVLATGRALDTTKHYRQTNPALHQRGWSTAQSSCLLLVNNGTDEASVINPVILFANFLHHSSSLYRCIAPPIIYSFTEAIRRNDRGTVYNLVAIVASLPFSYSALILEHIM